MSRFIFSDAESVKAQIASLKAEYAEDMEDDATLLLDMLSGSTDFEEVMNKVLSLYIHENTLASARKQREKDLKELRERGEARADGYKALMLSMMQVAGVEKVPLVEGTLSLTKPRTSVNVIDVDALEQPFYSIVRQADKAAIKEAIEAGSTVNGAELVLGEQSISVRVK